MARLISSSTPCSLPPAPSTTSGAHSAQDRCTYTRSLVLFEQRLSANRAVASDGSLRRGERADHRRVDLHFRGLIVGTTRRQLGQAAERTQSTCMGANAFHQFRNKIGATHRHDQSRREAWMRELAMKWSSLPDRQQRLRRLLRRCSVQTRSQRGCPPLFWLRALRASFPCISNIVRLGKRVQPAHRCSLRCSFCSILANSAAVSRSLRSSRDDDRLAPAYREHYEKAAEIVDSVPPALKSSEESKRASSRCCGLAAAYADMYSSDKRIIVQRIAKRQEGRLARAKIVQFCMLAPK